MPSHVEPYADSPSAREELVPFLNRELTGGREEDLWWRRMVHWWDENPFAVEIAHRGWVLKAESKIVGFMAIIPAGYAVEGKFLPSMIASSWVIVPEHRNAAVAMGVQVRRLARQHLVLDTTPSEQVQAIITRQGWTGQTRAHRLVVPLGVADRAWSFLAGHRWPKLKPGRRLVTDPALVEKIARPWQQADRIEKWTTPETLRWYAASAARTHHFLGVVDEAGILTSFLWLTPRRRLGLPCLVLLEAFSTEPEPEELHALVGALASGEAAFEGEQPLLLSLVSFPGDHRWQEIPAVRRDEVGVCHFHTCPQELAVWPKHSVLAEGDYGL